MSTARRFLLVWAAVGAVAALAHFAFAPRMGLYEDDHWLIGVPMCEWHSPGQMWDNVWGLARQYFQGRPLQYGLGFALAYAGTHAGGLTGAYVLAAAIWILNAGLCLALLWPRFGPTVATVAALVFVLLPADTTHPMLHTAFFVQPSVTFLLLSGIAYGRGWRWLSVPLAGVTLVTYESCFLPALVWPLLFRTPERPLWRAVAVHGMAMGLLLAVAVFARVQTGEGRVAGAMGDKADTARKVGTLAVVGPTTSLRTFAERPVWVVRTWSGASFPSPGPGRQTAAAVAIAAGVAALLALLAAGVGRRSTEPEAEPVPVARLMAAGALLVVLSYVASVTRPPGAIDGRMSSVHIGSAVGWGVFFGGLVAGVTRRLKETRAAIALPVIVAAYLTLLAALHVYVQREYVRAWVAQGEFWRDVVDECPDVGPGTVILYPLVEPTSALVRYQEWADYYTFPHLFAVPDGWPPPRAFPIGHLRWGGLPAGYDGYDWNEIERDGDRLYLMHWDGQRVPLEPGNVILLQRGPNGRLQRMTGTVRMAGGELPLKPRGGAAFDYRPGALHAAMFPHGVAGAYGNRRVQR